ncbi:SDR family NAD(P)-dependent oxidoreductase [Lyngbya confervoides]|uniref:Glucose 1-dehydrogenase n=1 Tax=Lyngbya confervoides BDU141951 TaxID=1574623 RepID=A0ABD4SZD8_9CYAN|nr:glucose 1-dehydrogenase [Lyngbya confervoides]MCM1981710.1 glucose 1-dehydrogenase [Lyngbya confervoides BDU141951]
MKLTGKVAIVTGGSRGIGAAICDRLAKAGADVVINYRSHQEGAQATLEAVQKAGASGHIVQADLSQVENIQRLVEESIEHFGKVDILVNNAGLEKRSDFWEVTEAEYDLVLNVNLKAVFFACQAVVRHFRATQNPGRIINISSVHEELPFPHFTSYCASKGGVQMITRNLAVELGEMGITVNNVSPGAIATSINQTLLDNPEKRKQVTRNIPLGRLGDPEDVAGLVAFLASDEAKYVTGSTFYVDGGLLWNYKEQ